MASADESAAQEVLVVDREGSSAVDGAALGAALAAVEPSPLAAAEIAGLQFMREEEKLARDLYLALYDRWSLRTFSNIASSEQTHTDAVRALIDRYDLEDPALERAAGVFSDAGLQVLHDDLVALGGQSLEQALRVGAAIEEIDILDLEERLAQTDNADISVVYENLMKGSRNHLRAFSNTLASRLGETYVPQYLDAAAYEAIVGASLERGR